MIKHSLQKRMMRSLPDRAWYTMARLDSRKMGGQWRISEIAERQTQALPWPGRRQLRFACRDLKEIIDDRERQPPNLAERAD